MLDCLFSMVKAGFEIFSITWDIEPSNNPYAYKNYIHQRQPLCRTSTESWKIYGLNSTSKTN